MPFLSTKHQRQNTEGRYLLTKSEITERKAEWCAQHISMTTIRDAHHAFSHIFLYRKPPRDITSLYYSSVIGINGHQVGNKDICFYARHCFRKPYKKFLELHAQKYNLTKKVAIQRHSRLFWDLCKADEGLHVTMYM